jgi:hypothetical protein
MAAAWLIHGDPMNVHAVRELFPFAPKLYLIGAFGLLLDGTGGLLFQAPFYLLGIFAIVRWTTMPESFRLGCISAALYVFYLVPRSEWHGGWSPPLRYIVIFTPLLALGAAVLIERTSARRWLPLIAIWTAGVTAHGLAQPWRLFHIANGESVLGEGLSTLLHADISRLIPSFIHLNTAALVGAVVLVLSLVAFRFVRVAVPAPAIVAIAMLLLAFAFEAARRPGRIVQFEHAHVEHQGGELYPELYTVGRFLYRDGWIVRAGDSLSFLVQGGRSQLYYRSTVPSVVEIGGRALSLNSTDGHDTSVTVELPRSGRVVLRCLSGEVNLDRIEHE